MVAGYIILSNSKNSDDKYVHISKSKQKLKPIRYELKKRGLVPKYFITSRNPSKTRCEILRRLGRNNRDGKTRNCSRSNSMNIKHVLQKVRTIESALISSSKDDIVMTNDSKSEAGSTIKNPIVLDDDVSEKNTTDQESERKTREWKWHYCDQKKHERKTGEWVWHYY